MGGWKCFWQGLNIRKALALLFGIAMIIGSLAIVFTGLSKDTIDKDLINLGITGIVTLTTTLVGYYFGYSNALNQKDHQKDTEDQM